MPWSCIECGGEISDDLRACPGCAQRKTAWTVSASATRTMRITRRRFTLHRGVDTTPGAPGAVEPALVPTTEARVLDKEYAEALRASGRAPAPADTLFVALGASGATDLTVRGEVMFDGKPSEPFEVPIQAPPGLEKGAVVLVPLILVRGAGPAVARDAFVGATVLDVDEPTADGATGHAPTLELEALGRPAQAVALVARKGVARAILGDLHFETSKRFLLPGAISSLRCLIAWYATHPGHEVLVVGHADKAGDAAYNLSLSLERARAVAAYLRDDVDDWLASYEAAGATRWGTREDQHMLSALADADGMFYTSPVDGLAGPATSSAVTRFQAWSNGTRGTSLGVDGACGPLTRRELVAAYMAQDQTTLPADTPLLTFGCGEWFPAVETSDGVGEAENRRVDLMFFPDGVDPRPADETASGPDDPHYPAWRGAIVEEIAFEDRADAYEVLVVIERSEDLDDRFELASSDGAYSRTLGLPDGEPCDRGVVLYFDDLLEGPTYTLTHLPDATRRITLFSGATRSDLLAPRPAPQVYDPPAPPGEAPEEPWTGDECFSWTEDDERIDPAWLAPALGEKGGAA